MFLWSLALNNAMVGEDPIAGLRQARVRADGEGHDISADVVLALVVIEQLAGRRVEAAELLGLAMASRLNNLSHYVLARTLRAELGDALGAETLGGALRRGAGQDPNEVLAALALSVEEPTART
jgi:hypothetical protein